MNERDLRIAAMTALSDLKSYWNSYKDEMDKECHRNYITQLFEKHEEKMWEIIKREE